MFRAIKYYFHRKREESMKTAKEEYLNHRIRELEEITRYFEENNNPKDLPILRNLILEERRFPQDFKPNQFEEARLQRSLIPLENLQRRYEMG